MKALGGGDFAPPGVEHRARVGILAPALGLPVLVENRRLPAGVEVDRLFEHARGR